MLGQTASTMNLPKSDRPLAIETVGLRKEYGAKVAVHDLSIAVPQGEVFGFLGPNGAGKSTTMKILLGLAFATAGTARLLGQPLGSLAVKRQIGFLPEQFRFHEWLRGTEFLDFHGELAGVAKNERRRRIPEVLELVGLEKRGGDQLRTYSKGMLQRIGLAQALLNEPTLVFLDEPTSALDPIGRREVREIIRGLKERGLTVFLNSHILSEVETVCDRVAIIDHGRVVRAGPLTTLLAESLVVDLRLGPYDATLLEQLATFGTVEATEPGPPHRIQLAISSLDQVPALAQCISDAGVAIYGITPQHRSLEDLFISAVKGGTE